MPAICSRPRATALYDFLMAPETLGRPFLVSGRVPAAQVAALRRAFAAMLADPDFRKKQGTPTA
jgi:hypothetical protein